MQNACVSPKYNYFRTIIQRFCMNQFSSFIYTKIQPYIFPTLGIRFVVVVVVFLRGGGGVGGVVVVVVFLCVYFLLFFCCCCLKNTGIENPAYITSLINIPKITYMSEQCCKLHKCS